MSSSILVGGEEANFSVLEPFYGVSVSMAFEVAGGDGFLAFEVAGGDGCSGEGFGVEQGDTCFFVELEFFELNADGVFILRG